MQFRNGKIILDKLGLNGWGFSSRDKDALVKAAVGSPIWVDKGAKHESDEDRFAEIGHITSAEYDDENKVIKTSGIITDSNAEMKFRDGTWSTTWSPRALSHDPKNHKGFLSTPELSGMTVVRNPAWENATFEINDTPLYAFVGDADTPAEEVVEKKHPLKINNTPPPVEEDDDDDESEITLERAPQRVKTIQPREVKATKKLDFVSRDDFDELKELITSMTQNTIKPATEPTTESTPVAPSGLGVDDVLKILAAREEKKAHTDAIEEYINVSKSKGIEVNPDDLKAFNKLKSDEVKIFTKQMGSVQTKSVFNSAPSYLNVATGESHMKSTSESGLTVGIWNSDTNSWDV